MKTPFLFVAISLCLAACGGSAQKAGDACSGTGALCVDASNALECVSSKYRAVACRGTGGCKTSNGELTCDMTKNKAGDGCLSSAEGLSDCDGNRAVACTNGVFSEMACTNCAVQGNQIVCQ